MNKLCFQHCVADDVNKILASQLHSRASGIEQSAVAGRSNARYLHPSGEVRCGKGLDF
jgi:hypothetical protein